MLSVAPSFAVSGSSLSLRRPNCTTDGCYGKVPPPRGFGILQCRFAGFRNKQSLQCTASPQNNEERAEVIAAKLLNVDEDPSPFFDGFLRSFLLGLSIGGLFEAIHVSSKLFTLLGEVGYARVSAAAQASFDQFAPLFVQDHVAAIASWALLYGIEVVTIISILNRYPNDEGAAASALRKVVTVSKKLLPIRLQIFKRFLLAGTNRAGFALATGSARTRASGLASGIQLLSNGFVVTDSPAMEAGNPTQAVLEAPTAALPEIIPGLEPAPEAAPKSDPLSDLEKRRRSKGLKPGAFDTSTSAFSKRQKELIGRRSYLRNFWYAAALSEKVVADRPLGVEILGQKVVLFRDDSGAVHCVSDVCPHRGAPLSQGWLADVPGSEGSSHKCVVCPYHGWAIDAKGYLRDVPAAEHDGEWPAQAPVVDVYPVEERGGFVWLFYGSPGFPVDERPPIPFVPELEDGQWKAVYGEIEFNCSHWGVFENAIDMAHIHYLHSDTFGNQDKPEIRNMHCTTQQFSVTANFQLHNKPVSAMWEWSKVPAVDVTAHAFLPSTSVISFTLGNGLSFTTFVNTVPIGGNRTINRFALVRNISWDRSGVFNMDLWDRMAHDAMIRILTEDKGMVEELRPDLLTREISVKADLPQIAFRKLRQSFIDMGYGVLPEMVDEPFNKDL